MAVWRTASVSEQPSLHVSHWRIYETDIGERHVVGWCIENSEGRVSSALVAFDAEAALVVTKSGRIYQLHGASGYDADANYPWRRWCAINDVTGASDVTHEVEQAIERERRPSPQEGPPQ